MLSSSHPARSPGDPAEQPIQVLLVDDDEDEFIITKRLLSTIEGRKYHLSWVPTYEQALAAIQEDRYDIYLIDYRLSDKTGLDLLKDAMVMGCTSPMILLTGQEDRQLDIEAMRSGAWDYLVKGQIDAASLERSLRYTLEHKRVLDVLLENERQREKVMATLTHDLKTPIKAEFRVFELLLSERFGPLTKDQKDVIEEMLRSNRYMYQMVDNLLQAFRYEEGQLALRYEMTDLNELISSVAKTDLLSLVEDKGQALSISLEPSLPLVRIDPLELRRVITNLIQNAINYTQNGGEITIRTRQNDDFVMVDVQDNGPGIDPSMRADIFKPYASMAKRYRHIGTGLGLYISKTIIEAHGGNILVQSEPDKGSCFTFSLPKVSSAYASQAG